MPDFAKIAPYLSNELVLAGFALFLVVGLIRGAMALDIFRQVTSSATRDIILRAITYGFVLALAAVVGGFALAGYRAYLSADKSTAVAQHVPELESPQSVPLPEDAANTEPRAIRIREGKSDSPQRRFFDITLENPSSHQVVLDEWEIEWRYHPGALASVAYAQVIQPSTQHAVELPIDPAVLDLRNRQEPIQPTIVLPQGTPDAPSLHEMRLELFYVFETEPTRHPNSDWNIIFSLAIRTTRNELIPLFDQTPWRE